MNSLSLMRRSLLSAPKARALSRAPTIVLLRPMSSGWRMQKKLQSDRQIHSTAPKKADATATMPASAAIEVPKVVSSPLLDRFIITTEVFVSKIFPAGFCWQTGSLFAANGMGWAPDTLNFALSTGVGDAVGVLGGHMAYYAAKKAAWDSKINMTRELHTGILLASAAFCSGTAWQPTVNLLQGANLSFVQVATGTWMGCGLAFYVGLRVGRTLLSGPLEYVHEPTYENSKTDAALSVAIGGATGCFVGTDAAYLPDQNFLLPLVGITEGTPDVVGCALAGSSTALGFVAAQSTMNMIYPVGKCWNDGK